MLLPWLILIPFIGGFLCWQTERFGVKVPRWIALITMGLTFLLGLQLWMQGGYSLTQSTGIPQWQSEFVVPWIPRFGISIHLAIDGLSLLMVDVDPRRRDRRIPGYRPVPVLLLLGNDAGADVLPDRAVGP